MFIRLRMYVFFKQKAVINTFMFIEIILLILFKPIFVYYILKSDTFANLQPNEQAYISSTNETSIFKYENHSL